MRTGFEIALHTGCRLQATRIPCDCIDLARNTIHFPIPTKGRQPYTVPIHPNLLPTLTNIIARGETHTVPDIKGKSLAWRRFFDELHMPQYCFHCLRVTFISRGARAAIPETTMMRLVNHASTTVHRVYQRVGFSDLQTALGQIPLPPGQG